MNTIALVVGTRPEVIKCLPLVLTLEESKQLRPYVLASGQHSSMARQAFSAFGRKPELDLALMTAGQTPNSFLGALLPPLENALRDLAPSAVLVQGDTTTALGAALTAFHLQIPVIHLEAGLRTHRPVPFPEEMNRTLISRLAALHLCPTEQARLNLEAEGVREELYVVGNTVVDAALLMAHRLDSGLTEPEPQAREIAERAETLLLVTGHRRESFDGPLKNLCSVLKQLRDARPDLTILYPVHLNPRVRDTVVEALEGEERIALIEPVNYPTLLYLIRRAALIITDSGGIQEEAPSFNKRVLVTRVATERTEAIQAGLAELTPLEQPELLRNRALTLLHDPAPKGPPPPNPFGDGASAGRIVELLEQRWGQKR